MHGKAWKEERKNIVNEGIALALDSMNQVNSTVHTGYDFFSSPFSANPVIYSGRILMALLLFRGKKNENSKKKSFYLVFSVNLFPAELYDIIANTSCLQMHCNS